MMGCIVYGLTGFGLGVAVTALYSWWRLSSEVEEAFNAGYDAGFGLGYRFGSRDKIKDYPWKIHT